MNTLSSGLTFANYVDLGVLILLIVFCIAGSVRGFTGECGRILALVTTAATTFLLYPVFRAHVFKDPEIVWKVLSIVCTISVATILGVCVKYITKRFLRLIIGQPTDAIVGAVVSVLTTCLVLCTILFFVYEFPNDTLWVKLFRESIAGRLSEPIILFAKEKIILP